MTRIETNKFYDKILQEASSLDVKHKTGKESQRQAMRKLVLTDRFYLGTRVLGRIDADSDWVHKQCRMVEAEPDGCLDLWAREHYKSKRLSEPVPTPSGWSKHGDLDVGDKVIGSDGKPVSVIAKTKVFYDGPAYNIIFTDGTEIKSGADHLWPVGKRSRKRISGNKRVLRENYLFSTKEIFEYQHKPDNRLSLDVSTILELPEKELLIDPYTLGAWLGDGFSSGSTIGCSDKDFQIMDEIKKSYSVHSLKCKQKNFGRYTFNYGLLSYNRMYKVFKRLKLKNNKHIPGIYLRGSKEQRLSLLQGLMDTDGSCNPRGTATFTNINKELIDNVYELCCTLGLNPKLRKYTAKYKGEPYIFYNIAFQAYKSLPVFRLERKLKRCKDGKPWSRKYIKDCVRIDPEPMSCIQVENKDGIYIVGKDFLPTHNSTIISFWGSIQEICLDQEITIVIFSFNRPIARAFLKMIMKELEDNETLKWLFPEIFWANPKKDSRKYGFSWSAQEGICVKRKTNPNEQTLEAWGLIDAQPTALAIDTPIYTTDGWKDHGDLVPGDYVYDDNGNPVVVIHNTGIMEDKDCRKVIFNDTDIVAAADHLWPVDKRICPRVNGKQPHTWDISERLILRTDEIPVGRPGNSSYRMPRTPSLNLCTKELLLDPYVLGYWLGDGSTNQNMITTADKEVLVEIKKAGFEAIIKQDRGSYGMYTFPGLWEKLKSIGVTGNKHIPSEYKNNSRFNRLALFQGLMDSDGSSRKEYSQCVFTNTNYNLIVDTHFLSASLGMQPCPIKEYWDGDKNHKIRYTFSFTGIKSEKPFRLERKLENCKKERRNKGRYVRDIIKIDSVPVNCIQVGSEDGLYLAGRSMVVTHNSKHFMLRIYNDVVTDKTCLTQTMRDKATDGWKLSQNLGRTRWSEDEPGRMWHEGTIYHMYDTYNHIKNSGEVKPRLFPATEDGTLTGKPVFMTNKMLAVKYKTMGPYIFASQMLMDPLQENKQGFKEEWIQYWPATIFKGLNIMIICDPASKKGKKNDYTVFFVIGLGPDRNYYVVDFIRDKLSLTERATTLFRLQQKYDPVFTGYEEVAMQSDREHFEYVMEQNNYRFHITPMHEGTNKQARILSLVPMFEQGRIFFPEQLFYTNYEGINVDLVKAFKEEEFTIFPFIEHDDMLDCLAKINHKDVFIPFPEGSEISLFIGKEEEYASDEEEYDVFAV